jgi:hypothetical protein
MSNPSKYERVESDTVTLSLPLAEILQAFIPHDDLSQLEGCKVSAWSTRAGDEDAPGEDAGDDVLEVVFSRSKSFVRDESGALVEKARDSGGACVTRKQAEKLIAEALEKKAPS